MIKQISIFDLDGTTIDSSHRQVTDSKGNLDLNKWFENATPSKIFKDKVLPSFMRFDYRKGEIDGLYQSIDNSKIIEVNQEYMIEALIQMSVVVKNNEFKNFKMECVKFC